MDGTNPNSQAFSLTALKNAFASTATTQGIFAATQPPIIVPQPPYNSAYSQEFPDGDGADSGDDYDVHADRAAELRQLMRPELRESGPEDHPGALHGRLWPDERNTGHGAALTQFPEPDDDPARVRRSGNRDHQAGQTQLWKITHNGVDTHWIHFHLFNVQVINRVGWDGSIRPIDANEAGLEGHRQDESAGGHRGGAPAADANGSLPGAEQRPATGRDIARGNDKSDGHDGRAVHKREPLQR